MHLAWSLMQNEALTLYQSVKALSAIAPILSSTLLPNNICTWLVPLSNIEPEKTSISNRKYEQTALFYETNVVIGGSHFAIASKGVTGDHRDQQRRETGRGCDRESCEQRRMVHSRRDRFLFR